MAETLLFHIKSQETIERLSLYVLQLFSDRKAAAHAKEAGKFKGHYFGTAILIFVVHVLLCCRSTRPAHTTPTIF